VDKTALENSSNALSRSAGGVTQQPSIHRNRNCSITHNKEIIGLVNSNTIKIKSIRPKEFSLVKTVQQSVGQPLKHQLAVIYL